MNYKRLGDYIQPVNIRNKDLGVTTLLGVSIKKVLMPSIANTIGTNMKTYKIIEKNQFAYGPVTSRNGDKISIALLEEFDEAIVSQAYTVFEVIDENQVLPEYLMMWFRRPEFDRYARFKSHGSAREVFDWDELCDTQLPIPSIEKQRQLVAEYNTVTERIKLNEQLNQKLEESAQALYKHWFVDFEFPAHLSGALSGAEGYKSSGGEMVYNEELDKEIPVGWSVERLGDIIKFSKNRIEVQKLDRGNYISTENMLQDKRGVLKANSLPTANSVTKFNPGNILISNIRPYFKKIWLADSVGGCSNDVLCFEAPTSHDQFFYFTLEQDIFFNYVMQGAKGTKMPRGDKNWIMNYSLAISKNEIEIKFSNKINVLNNRIYANRLQSRTLKELESLLLAKMTQVAPKPQTA